MSTMSIAGSAVWLLVRYGELDDRDGRYPVRNKVGTRYYRTDGRPWNVVGTAGEELWAPTDSSSSTGIRCRF